MLVSAFVYLVVSLVAGAAAFAFVRHTRRSIESTVSQTVQENSDPLRERIAELDTAISSALKRFGELAPLDDIRSLERRLEELRARVVEEQRAAEEMHSSLSRAKENVSQRERHYNELKLGRDEAQRLADEIATHTAQMEREHERLQSEIENSRAQLQALSQEVTISEEQRKALEEVSVALEKMSFELTALSEAWEQAKDRFENLREQYADLEREYKKLIEAEFRAKGEST